MRLRARPSRRVSLFVNKHRSRATLLPQVFRTLSAPQVQALGLADCLSSTETACSSGCGRLHSTASVSFLFVEDGLLGFSRACFVLLVEKCES
jgi:hypothetical protein